MPAESPSSASTPSLPPQPTQGFAPKSAPKRPVPLKGSVPGRPQARPAEAASPLAQAELQLPVEQRAAAEEHEEPAEEGSLRAWTRNMPAWLISMLFHLIGILVLALLTLSMPEVRNELSMLVNPSEEFEPLEEQLNELDVEVDLDVEEMTDFEKFSDVEAFEDINAISETIGIEDAPPMETSIDDTINITGPGLASLMSDIPSGGSELGKMSQMTKFFGAESSGRRIAFLVDNSNSMTQGRMETALIELSKSIDQLSEKQYFYIVFYSDTAYPLFYPSTEAHMVRATRENKVRARQWLSTIQMCFRTNAKEAFEIAVKQRPDVIYVLGDGAIGDKVDIALTNKPLRGVTIHTLGMQVDPKNAQRFAALATAHKGTYRDVGITDEGKEMLKRQGPITKNNNRGPVWGLKLPAAQK